MVQAKHALLVIRLDLPSDTRFSCIASPEMACAPSNWTPWWLRVGSAPVSLTTFIKTWVP